MPKDECVPRGPGGGYGPRKVAGVVGYPRTAGAGGAGTHLNVVVVVVVVVVEVVVVPGSAAGCREASLQEALWEEVWLTSG